VTLLGGVQDLRPFVVRPREDSARLLLPAAALPRSATALIPVATLLPDYRHGSAELLSARSEEIEHARIQELVHCAYAPSDIDQFLSWGPRLWPFSVSIQSEGVESFQEVHALDPTNVYTLDRHWQMGCCPHLFFRIRAGLQYGGELLQRVPLFSEPN
jgi:hypothetical protein